MRGTMRNGAMAALALLGLLAVGCASRARADITVSGPEPVPTPLVAEVPAASADSAECTATDPSACGGVVVAPAAGTGGAGGGRASATGGADPVEGSAPGVGGAASRSLPTR